MKTYKISFKFMYWSSFGALIIQAENEERAKDELKRILTSEYIYRITKIERVNNKTTI